MGGQKFWNNDREALMGIVLLLILAGLVNVFSSSFILAETDFSSPYFFIKKHCAALAVGAIALGLTACMDYHRLQSFSGPLLVLTLVLLGAVFVFGPVINGARRWLPLGIAQFQPSELAKLVAIILEAMYLSYCVKRKRAATVFHSQLLMIGVMFLLVEREPDFTTAVIILGTPVVMMLISTIPAREKWGMIIFAVIVGAGICILQPYRVARLVAVLNPWADIRDSGYQVVQSMAAIGSGGFWGVGLGMGVSKYQYLPEAHTDFAFAVFCQENGFVLAFVIILLFAGFTFYGAKIANRAQDAFGQYLAAGITFMISGQAVMNLLMVSGWFPVVGVPLPFISYGGSALIVTLACVGILISIDRYRFREPKLAHRIAAAAPPPGKYPRLRRVK